MTIKLRTEQPADYAETEHVTREAFWNHYSPGCNEHYLLHIMRGSPSFIPELDVVAVHGGRSSGIPAPGNWTANDRTYQNEGP